MFSYPFFVRFDHPFEEKDILRDSFVSPSIGMLQNLMLVIILLLHNTFIKLSNTIAYDNKVTMMPKS